MKQHFYQLLNFSGEKQEVTDEIVEYYRKHPDELDLIVDKEQYHIRFLNFFFILGMKLTVISRILMFLFEDKWGAFMNGVVLDVMSELGIAIFGGAVTAFFLEFLRKRQYEENIRFRNEIKTRLDDDK